MRWDRAISLVLVLLVPGFAVGLSKALEWEVPAGPHPVTFSSGGREQWRETVTVRGGTQSVTVQVRVALPPGLGTAFEIPTETKDAHGNPFRKGTDPDTGWPLEIRHKATGMHLVFVSPRGSSRWARTTGMTMRSRCTRCG